MSITEENGEQRYSGTDDDRHVLTIYGRANWDCVEVSFWPGGVGARLGMDLDGEDARALADLLATQLAPATYEIPWPDRPDVRRYKKRPDHIDAAAGEYIGISRGSGERFQLTAAYDEHVVSWAVWLTPTDAEALASMLRWGADRLDQQAAEAAARKQAR